MIKLSFTLLFIFALCEITFTQDNTIFFTHNEISDTNIHKLNFGIESTSFVKNNEYFDHLKGWTGIGFFIKPQIIYQATKTTEIQAGYFLEKYSGLDQFNSTIPLFRIRQKLSHNWEMILGHLYGNLEHNLTEPVYRFDRYYTDNVEYGMQFLFRNKFISNDFWANWEQFIFPNDPYREEFVIGNSFNADIKINKKLSLIIPFQFTWTHAGGQIYEHIPGRQNIMSLHNTSYGCGFKYDHANSTIGVLNNKFLFKSLSADYKYHSYKAPDNPPVTDEFHQPYDNGSGHFISCNLDLNTFDLNISYWAGEKFIAKRGEEIFLSAFSDNNTFLMPEVRLLNFKILYKHYFSENVKLAARTDLYYNTGTGSLFYSYGLYLIYNDMFLLSKIRH